MNSDKDFISVTEAAQILKISRQAVYKKISTNNIKYKRFGKLFLVKLN